MGLGRVASSCGARLRVANVVGFKDTSGPMASPPLRSFATAFLAREPAAAAFLARDFRDPAQRAGKAHEASRKAVPEAVLGALARLDATLPPSPSRRAALEALARPGTVAVVSGQQMGLFLGPLYTVYKAATAITAARSIQAETGMRAVPVFWLQTEDHDFAEIATIKVEGRDGSPQDIAVAGPADRGSLSHRILGDDVRAALERLAAALPPGAAADETRSLLGRHYRPGAGVAAAFAATLAELFAEDGLVLLDPRVPALAEASVPLWRRAIVEADPIAEELAARGDALRRAGYQEQVPIRAGCSLAFLHEGGADGAGPRYRIAPGTAGFPLADVLAALEKTPLRFSNSALLRPVVQDALLPVSAYVGGPAEMSYFAQIGPLYDRLGVPQPLFVPRASFRLVDGRTRRLLAGLGLSAVDVVRPRHEIEEQVAGRLGGPGAPSSVELRRDLEATFRARLDALAAAAKALDPTLEKPACKTRDSIMHTLERMLDKLDRALIAKDGVTAARLERVRTALQPGGHPQERFYAFPSAAGRLGPHRLKRLVLAAVRPWEPGLRDLSIDEAAA